MGSENMPKQTFFNLSEDKKQVIIDTSIQEFALFDYSRASISRIVKTAGIAKGSIYQYFDNKAELYFYLIDYVSRRKLEFVNSHIDLSSTDFYSLYKSIILAACKFDLEFPSYSRMIYNVGHENYNEEIGEVSKRLMDASTNYLCGLVEQAQKRGQIRRDIDKELITFIISYLSVDIGEYIAKKFKFSYIDTIKQGKGSLPISIEDLSGVLDDLISFFQMGLQRNIKQEK
jgi:AcrR family transcriptional regulator